MNLKTFIRSLTLLLVLSGFANAKQYVTNYHGRQVVVHTNPVPVVLHRMVPPQYGRHVTVREIQAGQVPSAGRTVARGR